MPMRPKNALPAQEPTSKKPSPKPGSPIKGLLLGIILDLGGSFIFGLILLCCYIQSLAASGMTLDEINEVISKPPAFDSWYFISAALLGYVFSMLGGYVCARISKRFEYRMGIILASISSLFGILISYEYYSWPLNMFFTLLTFAFVLLGAKLGRAKNQKPA